MLAAILIPRARRRSAWDAELAGAEGDLAWLAQELIPQLEQAASVDEVAGGWQVAAGRVSTAEDRLTGLESTAPDPTRESRAHALRDAARSARHGMERLLVSRDSPTLHRDLASIATRLSAVLRAPRGMG